MHSLICFFFTLKSLISPFCLWCPSPIASTGVFFVQYFSCGVISDALTSAVPEEASCRAAGLAQSIIGLCVCVAASLPADRMSDPYMQGG